MPWTSLVNLTGATFALLMVSLALRPPDEDHPYGHHKAEYFSSGLEEVLMTESSHELGSRTAGYDPAAADKRRGALR